METKKESSIGRIWWQKCYTMCWEAKDKVKEMRLLKDVPNRQRDKKWMIYKYIFWT